MLGLVPSNTKITTVLDYGCGCGRMTYFLMLHPRWEVYGFDPDKECVEAAKLFAEYASFSDSLPDEKMDLIICSSVFSHVPADDQPELLRMLVSHLSDSGKIVVSFHSEDCYKEVFGSELQSNHYSLPADCFQRRDFTLEMWSKCAKIEAHAIKAYNKFQDIVVMSKLCI